MQVRHRSRDARHRRAAADPAAAGRERHQARHRPARRSGAGADLRAEAATTGSWIEVRDNGVGLSRNARARVHERRRPVEYAGAARMPVRQPAPARFRRRQRRPLGPDADSRAPAGAARLGHARRRWRWHDLGARRPHAGARRRRRAAGARAAAHAARDRSRGSSSSPSARTAPRRSTRSRRSQPDLVFLDVQMPGRHGLRGHRSRRRRHGCRRSSS